MISLFIDTSLSDVSIALVKEGKLLSSIHNNIPGEHSIYVTKYIEDILNNNKLSPKDINEIIIVNGPGSFTGIRIGVTIAKIFAYLTNIRIVSITTLQAKVIGKKGKYLLSLIDAKHNNYYIGLYEQDYNKLEEKFANEEEINEIKEKYNPTIVLETEEYDIEKIIEYTKNLPSINPHNINPIYLKLPEAMK